MTAGQEAAIEALAAEEFADFAGAGDPALAADELAHLHHRHHTAILFQVDRGDLCIWVPGSGDKRSIWDQPALTIAARARAYHRFLGPVVREAFPDRSFFFALVVGDEHVPTTGFPAFAFQKPLGANNLLLPDVDFMLTDCYATVAPDPLPLAAKQPRGVFAGSTSGRFLTHAVIEAGANQRLRSFLHFRGGELVDFRLPEIVQAAEPGVEARLRGMGLGGERLPWAEQLGYRFLLSLDGNGAACSRPYLALRSNSVLVKYASPSQLFYFRHLQPWVHFMPVGSDAEVERLIRRYGDDLPALSAIVANAHAFCDSYLSRPALQHYARALLAHYAGLAPERLNAPLAAALAGSIRLAAP